MFRTAFARSLAIALAAILAAPLVCAQIAWAQDPPPVRIRGTVERIDGATSVVKARDGVELKVTVADNAQIAGVIKASLSDIKQNSFVGVTAMPQPDGSLNAVEVHIFPESMRGTGEGHYPWDLQPQSHDDQSQRRAGRNTRTEKRNCRRKTEERINRGFDIPPDSVCSRRRVAEREGFEPPIRLPVCRISSAVHSTTLPPLQH